MVVLRTARPTAQVESRPIRLGSHVVNLMVNRLMSRLMNSLMSGSVSKQCTSDTSGIENQNEKAI